MEIPETTAPKVDDESLPSHSSRFRFKSKVTDEPSSREARDQKRRKRDDSSGASDSDHKRHHHHRRRHHRRRHHRQRRSESPDRSRHSPPKSPSLSPTQAFRESLFDALADDEGAAYWESVYGQPIHVYPNKKQGPDGELERMTDEEYAEYVRSRMWEKTHQHVIEERKRREEAKLKNNAERERLRRSEEEREIFERQIEESLRRGEKRKEKRKWNESWGAYIQRWEDLKAFTQNRSEDTTSSSAACRIPWPVQSGKRHDVSKSEIEDFFRKAPPTDMDIGGMLKSERVRWHPDKMQQRFGKDGLDSDTMKSITAVFQVVDRIWNDLRDKKDNV